MIVPDPRDSQVGGPTADPVQREATGPVPAGPRKNRDAILVGNGGPLVVPREDLAIDLDDGLDLDLGGLQTKKVRRPGRREWISLDPSRGLTTRLLPRPTGPNGLEVEHFFVAPDLRGPVREEIRDVVVYPFFSHSTRTFALWIVNVTPDNSWYESIAPLFQQPANFYAHHAFRVISDRPNGRYRVKYKPAPSPDWPSQSTEALLGEALGPLKFIRSADHRVYQELLEGDDLA
jgi:hypothetical protein